MAERRSIEVAAPARLPAKESVKFVTSGSKLLDLALGGGYAQGRIVNIVGDKSAGKTLLAIEACANFSMRFGSVNVRYLEAEQAFDEDYAAQIGMPPDIELARDINTIEGFVADLIEFVEARKNNLPCLYVVDSLDALSDETEQKREFGQDTYGQDKAKRLSEFFRKENYRLVAANCTLLIISQVRDNIGVTFGEKHKRSGGKALDFYASQVLWLAHIQQLKRTVRGVERVTGAKIEAKLKKNKVAPPFRQVELTVIFSYGIDDEVSLLNWIDKHKAKESLTAVGLSYEGAKKALDTMRAARDREGLRALHAKLAQATLNHWMDVEADLAPTISKYGLTP